MPLKFSYIRTVVTRPARRATRTPSNAFDQIPPQVDEYWPLLLFEWASYPSSTLLDMD
jgi:hypothetical protein